MYAVSIYPKGGAFVEIACTIYGAPDIVFSGAFDAVYNPAAKTVTIGDCWGEAVLRGVDTVRVQESPGLASRMLDSRGGPVRVSAEDGSADVMPLHVRR